MDGLLVCENCGLSDFVSSQAQVGALVCSQCGSTLTQAPLSQDAAVFGAAGPSGSQRIAGDADAIYRRVQDHVLDGDGGLADEGVNMRGRRVRTFSKTKRQKEKASEDEDRSVPGLAWLKRREYWRKAKDGRRMHDAMVNNEHARGVDVDGHVQLSTSTAAYVEGVQELLLRCATALCTATDSSHGRRLIARPRPLMECVHALWERHIVSTGLLSSTFSRDCRKYFKRIRSGRTSRLTKQRRRERRQRRRAGSAALAGYTVDAGPTPAAAADDRATETETDVTETETELDLPEEEEPRMSDSSSDDDMPITVDDDRDEERIRKEQQLAGMSRFSMLLKKLIAKRLALSDVLCILYIVCRWLREPLGLADVLALAADGRLPVLASNAVVPESIKFYAPLGAFAATATPSIEKLHQRSLEIACQLGVPIPPVNLPPALELTCSSLGLDVSSPGPASWAARLLEAHAVPMLELEATEKMDGHMFLRLPDVWLVAAVVVTIRIVCHLKWEEASDGDGSGDGGGGDDAAVRRWSLAFVQHQRRRLRVLGYTEPASTPISAPAAAAGVAMGEGEAIAFFRGVASTVSLPSDRNKSFQSELEGMYAELMDLSDAAFEETPGPRPDGGIRRPPPLLLEHLGASTTDGDGDGDGDGYGDGDGDGMQPRSPMRPLPKELSACSHRSAYVSLVMAGSAYLMGISPEHLHRAAFELEASVRLLEVLRTAHAVDDVKLEE